MAPPVAPDGYLGPARTVLTAVLARPGRLAAGPSVAAPPSSGGGSAAGTRGAVVRAPSDARRSPAGWGRSPGNAGRSPSSSSGSSGSPEAPGSAGSSGSRGSGGSRGSRGSRRSVSGRLPGAARGSAPSVSARGSRPTGSSSGRGELGLGLVAVPEVPRADPASVVLTDPEVPERKRFCGNGDCGFPVGRSRAGRAGRTAGFCTRCGRPYSFVPKLRPGEVVHGQYEIAGCLAHGGLGWIYLAVDRAVAHRWVVLKGLLDTGDEDAMAAAIAERRFLAEIEHANIVRIYNFVEHPDPRDGTLDGYIVMEYVGGRSLKDIANARRAPDGGRAPLPVDQACAYGIEALEALGHLHERGLLYCDFKVDNAIQQDGRLKLIDMGAVRRADDDESPIYGTVGYQAPEVAAHGASVASDLYTVARTLAVLTLDFQGYTSVYVDSLPDPEHVAVFRKFESYYRFLARATDPDPQRRFASAREMADQLLGVLREVVALGSGRPRPALSTLFTPELRVASTELLTPGTGDASLLGARRPARGATRRERGRRGRLRRRRPAAPRSTADGANDRVGGGGTDAGAFEGAGDGEGAVGLAALPLVPLSPRRTALALPLPRVDPADPNAAFLAALPAAGPEESLAALRGAPGPSLELSLREVRGLLELPPDTPVMDPPSSPGGFSGSSPDGLPGSSSDAAAGAGPAGAVDPSVVRAATRLTAVEEGHPDDWRVVWYRGLCALAGGDRETAALAFDAVYDAFPGETAPKLALGCCAETLGQWDNAAEFYRLVWVADPAYVSAAFGLARVRLAGGDRPGAVEVLESVPETSIHYVPARVAAVRARLRHRAADEPLLPDLYAAADQIDRLRPLGLDAVRREELSAEVLGSALDWTLAGRAGAPAGGTGTSTPSVMLLGCTMDENGLRSGLERGYRVLARLARSGTERNELVERANRFRPRTWV
ncbi:tetratricopeptide repeat protein [Streptomyces sp. AJS327]|nr:tetratricopeptide repeat protein [Streptomyces sp. AJS327]